MERAHELADAEALHLRAVAAPSVSDERSRRRYDHRIRDAVVEGRNIAIVQQLAIPRPLVVAGAAPVVSLHPRDLDMCELVLVPGASI